MELNDRTFKSLEDSLDSHVQFAVNTVLGGNVFGLIPGRDFNCNGFFVKNSFEIENFKCEAVLRSGRFIDADEKVIITIPVLHGEEYYLTVTPGEAKHVYEKNGVPMVRPEYVFGINTLEELHSFDLFPVMRFKISGGNISVDNNFIVPVLVISQNEKILSAKGKFIEMLSAIVNHSHLDDKEGKRAFLHYLFLLRGSDHSESLKRFIDLTVEIAQAVEYYLFPLPTEEESYELSENISPDYYDIEKWLSGFEQILLKGLNVLDNFIPVDNSIDYEALLQQAKNELYDRLSPELIEQLPAKIKEQIYTEIVERLKTLLPPYLEEKLREMRERAEKDISESVTPKLFDDLYEKLYAALYIPPEEEEEFMPMI